MGLGNQMFTYAVLYGLAAAANKTPTLYLDNPKDMLRGAFHLTEAITTEPLPANLSGYQTISILSSSPFCPIA